jgi:hypothetical protein
MQKRWYWRQISRKGRPPTELTRTAITHPRRGNHASLHPHDARHCEGDGLAVSAESLAGPAFLDPPKSSYCGPPPWTRPSLEDSTTHTLIVGSQPHRERQHLNRALIASGSDAEDLAGVGLGAHDPLEDELVFKEGRDVMGLIQSTRPWSGNMANSTLSVQLLF